MRSAHLAGALVAAGVAILVLPAFASAAQRHAAPNGNGPAGSCPRANPCSLSDAVGDASVRPGDTVILRRGRYRARGGVAITQRIAVRGPGRGSPARIVGSADSVLVLMHPGAAVRQLRVTKSGPGGQAVVVLAGVLDRTRVEAGRSTACLLAGANPGDAEVRNSICSGQLGAAVGAFAPGAVFGTLNGVTAFSPRNQPAISTVALGPGAEATALINNTIAFGAPDIAASTDGAPGAAATVAAISSSYARVREQGAGSSITRPGSGRNIARRARFHRPGKGDLRQAPRSPTIDSGVRVDSSGKRDIAGNRRVQGRAIDIGAHESSDPRHLLRLRGRRVRARDTMTFNGRCPIAACRVTGNAILRSGGERVRLRVKPARTRQGGRVRLRVEVFPGARQILGALGGTIRLRLTVRDPVGVTGQVRRTYRIR